MRVWEWRGVDTKHSEGGGSGGVVFRLIEKTDGLKGEDKEQQFEE